MYSERWIKKYGEEYLYNYLKNNRKVKLTSHNEDDANLSIAIEHFLVKYKNSSDPIINSCIDSLFNAFYNNPLIYSYSYILSNELIVKSIINNNDKRKQLFIGGKNKLINGWKNTYDKLMNDEPVNINDKNKMLVLFTMGIRNGNKKQKEIIEKYVQKLLNKNEIPNNDFEKLLLFNYASRMTLGSEYNMVDTFIKLANRQSKDFNFLGGSENNGCILMNDHPSTFPFYQTLDEMIQCVCHETTHAIQEQQAINNPNNVHGMEMAIQELFGFGDYLEGDNYLFNEIEENAQRNGYYMASIIYGMANRNDITRKLIEQKQKYLKDRRFQYEYVTIIENGQTKRISKEKYNVENIRRVVKNNPHLIKKYPVLKNIFDDYGNSKSLEEMLSEGFKSHDISYMYKDFIIYDIRRNGLDNINLSNKDEKYKYNVLNNLCNVFNDSVNKTIDIIRDYNYRNYNTNKTSFFFQIHLKDVFTLADYIEKEMPFMRAYEKKHPGNYNLYTTYTNGMRLLLDNIDRTYKENKLTNLELPIKNNRSKLQNYEINMKKEYMNYILEHFTETERRTKLKFSNRIITLEEFVRKEVFVHMDRNHYIYNNNLEIINYNNGNYISPIKFVRDIFEKHKINELDDMFKNNSIDTNQDRVKQM